MVPAAPDAVDPAPALRGAQATAEVWNTRHQALDALRSGGHAGLDEPSNEILYAVRLGRLIDVVGDRCEPSAPMRVLDAGCGKGWFARKMATFGHRVDGIDVSEHAIEVCRSQSGGRDSYAVSALDAWRPGHLYDVVYSVDVLFHVMDDGLWERSLRNLASLVCWGGLLVLAEHEAEEDRTWSDYQRTRSLTRYRGVLADAGFSERTFVPNRFRSGQVGFLVMVRSR